MHIPSLRRAGRLGVVGALGLAATLATAGASGASNSPSASIVNRTLSISGSNGPDDIVLAIAPSDPNTLLVDFGNDGTVDEQFDRNTFDALSVSLGTGDDRFAATGVSIPQSSTIDGGNGDDHIVGTASNDVITGGNGNDFVAGGVGHDVGALDRGDDTFLWDPGEGSDDVDGSSGNDTLLFDGANGTDTMSLSAAGTRAVFFRVQGNVTMNLDNVEQVDVHALRGTDTVTVNDMTGTAMASANIDLSASGNSGAGDGQADVVTVNGTNQDDHVTVVGQGSQVDVTGLRTETRIAGSDAADQLQVNTRDGNDTVTVDPSAIALIGVSTDLGAGQH